LHNLQTLRWRSEDELGYPLVKMVFTNGDDYIAISISPYDINYIIT